VWEKLEQQLKRYEELEQQMSDAQVAADPQRYNAIAREHGALSRVVLRYRRYKELNAQLEQANELADDPDLGEMAGEELERLRPLCEDAKNELIDLVIGDDDESRDRLIMEIRAGTGGEEATLFARDLFDMYRRFAENRGWQVEVMDFNASEHRGFKEVVFSVKGDDAFRTLQFESGGHRVQRVPETEAQGRIHTSAATVAVLPEPEDVEINIRPEDIEMEAIRSSGPGGQHVNKTSSAVRLTHVPSGLVVLCQEERSQHKNRAKAMRLLRTRLYDMIHRQKQAERANARRTLIGSGDRSERIRTYNFPQNRCTDHRLGENFNLEEVIAGNLDKLVRAMQTYDRDQRMHDLGDPDA
jgi:peptide chain release factor 1